MPRSEDVLMGRPGGAATTMPVYTHYQAALPVTFGH
jgi:argininosuccinate lyase